MAAVRQVQHVIEEAVFFIPQFHAVVAQMIHRVRDVDEMLPELAGYVFVNRIFTRQLHRNCQQVERVHRHPAGAV